MQYNWSGESVNCNLNAHTLLEQYRNNITMRLIKYSISVLQIKCFIKLKKPLTNLID